MESGAPLLDRIHVLVVDEDAATRSAIEAIVTEHGGSANGVGVAERAIAFATVIRPTVVVSDLRLGGGRRGVWLLDQFRSGSLASVPVIAMSAYPTDEALATSLRFSAFLTKPVDELDVCALILGTTRRPR